MKQNKYLLLAASVLTMAFAGCKTEAPFDTQSADDFPQILTPFNQSGPNYFTPELANPDVLFDDSVVVTPSAYTTVRWYLDEFEVWEGTHMVRTFRAGEYTLRVKATTTAGKSTERYSPLTVKPYDDQPYSAPKKLDRYVMAGEENTLSGVNLSGVSKVLLSKTFDATSSEDYVEATQVSATDGTITYTVPADMAEGTYVAILEDNLSNRYGANRVFVHTKPLITSGFYAFTSGKRWMLKGLAMDRIKSIHVGDTTITEFLSQNATSVAFTAPIWAAGEYTISAECEGGMATFLSSTYEEKTSMTATCSEKKIILIASNVNVGCNGDPEWTAKRIDNDFDWSKVSVGTVIYVEAHRDAATTDYSNFQIMTPDWGFRYPDADHNLEFDGENAKVFEITVTAEMLAAFTEKGMGAAGHGTVIDRIYMDAPDETVIQAAPTNVGCNGDPDWTGKRVDDEFDWTEAFEGQILRFYAHKNPGADYSKFTYFGTNEWRQKADIEVLTETSEAYEVTLTQTQIDAFIAADKANPDERGLWVGGHGVVIDKITIE